MSDKELLTINKDCKDISFDFMGDKINVSAGRNLYNDIRLKFRQIMWNADDEFVKLYKSNYDMDAVHRHALEQGDTIIFGVLDALVDKLVDEGFYNLSREKFIDEYYSDYYDYQEYFDKIDEKYLKIVMTKEQEEEYRRLRKENRGRWVGGGFGVGGAIKGAATAGLMNAGAGILHGIANAAGNAMSSIQAGIDKRRLFEDPETLKELRAGVRSSVDGIRIAYMDFFCDNYSNQISIVSSDDAEEAETIFNNIKQREIDKATEIGLLKQIIELDPYNYEVYEYILAKYGDEKNEIDNIAVYFGYNLTNFKQEVIKKWFADINLDTEENALEAKNLLMSLTQRIGVSSNTVEEQKIIEQKLIDFDNEARTFEGVVFGTREEGEQAKIKQADIERIYEQKDDNSISSLLTTYNELYEKKSDSKLHKLHIDYIADKLNIIQKSLNEKIDASLKKDIKQADSLKGVVAHLEISDLTKAMYLNVINEKVKKWEEKDVKERTVWDKVYDTKEEAEQVRQSLTFAGTLYKTEEEVKEAKKEFDNKRAAKIRKKTIIVSSVVSIVCAVFAVTVCIIVTNYMNYKAMKNALENAIARDIKPNFIYIPDNDKTSAFYISDHEVTCGEVHDKKWAIEHKEDKNYPFTPSWYMAIEYCNKLSIKEGLTPCYTIDKEHKDPNNKNSNDDNLDKKWLVTWDKNANGYRLPTVIEWEYAAQGGSQSKGYKYSGSNNIKEVAWYRKNELNRANKWKSNYPVKMKKPNELGIYDMTGNVSEWCWDWDWKSDNQQITKDYSGPSSGYHRIYKGGACYSDAVHCSIAVRDSTGPYHSSFFGFRVVRSAK